MKSYAVIPLDNGRGSLRLRRVAGPSEAASASWRNMKELAAGQMEAVKAAANLIAPDDWDVATCITPNGRIDSHGKMVRMGWSDDGHRVSGSVCDFCGEMT